MDRSYACCTLTVSDAMNRTPVADWQQLSALYELADTLDPDSLDDWLVQLRQQAHPLLSQLEQMLAARSQIQRNGFLGALPRLPALPEPRAIEWQGGSRIGPYRLLRKIGSGGMAEVWLAQRDDGAFQRQVAIKLLFRHRGSDALDSFAQRFDRERDILASLNHPHIAGLHDAGVTPSGQPWLALEYVEGQTLTTWCDARYLSIEARVRLFRQVLLAVQHAHANLVIHRDLKPGNILVTVQGEVRLLDFGIAKLMEAEGGALAETELTRMAGRPMTPQYASPEQLTGQPLTTACDVYSLGVVLYELLCGERPYELKVESTAQLEQAILDVEPRGPSRRALTESTATARGTTGPLLRKQLASDLDAIVLRALAKQPTQRYGSVEALGADLDRWLGGEAVEARAPSTVYRVGKFVRRHTLSVSLGVGAVVALVGVAAVAVVMGLQAREDSARALAARDFMMGMFKQADADKSRGADITARELLDRGRDDVMRRLNNQPRLQADLLEGIAGIQDDMQEFTKLDITLDQLTRVRLSAGQADLAAVAIAARADNALQMGNDALAYQLIDRARATARPGNRDAELEASLGLTEAWLALRHGDAERAKALFKESSLHAVAGGDSPGQVGLRALSGLVQAERRLYNFDAAIETQSELERVVGRLPQTTPRDHVVLDIGRAELLAAAGQYREALEHDTRASARCASLLGPNDANCRRLTYGESSAFLRLGWADRTRPVLADLEAVAFDSSSPDTGAAALLLVFQARSILGDLVGRPDLVERTRKLARSGAEVVVAPGRKLQALLLLAEDQLRSGRTSEAERCLVEALAKARTEGRVAPEMSAMLQSTAGVIRFGQGRFAEALDEFQKGTRDVESSLGSRHTLTLLSLLNEANVLAQLNRADEARERIGRVKELLARALGRDAPVLARLTQLEAQLGTGSTGARVTTKETATTARRPRLLDVFFI
ncbi:MAG: serine/threonine-protein kinase [Burkholderiales bacterium]